MKHVKRLGALLESVSRGSVVLIKGRPEEGGHRLFASHAVGSVDVKPGVKMVFLSDEFYRIVREGNRLKAIKIYYQSEDSLKSVLNLRSPGKIGLVLNSKKTPFHWRTTKHDNLAAAILDVENDLLGEDYLLEPAKQRTLADSLEKLYKKIAIDTLDTLFFSQRKIHVLNYEIEESLEREINDVTESMRIQSESMLIVPVVSGDQRVVDFLEKADLDQTMEVSFNIETDVDVQYDWDPGDYESSGSSSTDYEVESTRIVSIYVDGSEVELIEPIRQRLAQANQQIRKLTPLEIKELLDKKKVRRPFLSE